MRNTLLLVALATTFHCSSDDGGAGSPPPAPDQAVASDLSVAPDLSVPRDMADTSDMTPEVDMVEVGPCGMHDPTNASCDDISTWIKDWLACHTVCSNDVDCALVSAHNVASCRNPCDLVANAQADGPYLQSLNDAFAGNACGRLGCACFNPGIPTCVKGMCTGM
jgi:hypothetical protein